MLNEVRIIGRPTKDVEKREVSGKGYFLTFPIAVNESYKKDGEWQERTDFFDVEIFVSNPENLEKILKKGNLLLIIGKLRQDRWEDDKGKHYKVKILAQRILLLREVQQASDIEETEGDEDIEL